MKRRGRRPAAGARKQLWEALRDGWMQILLTLIAAIGAFAVAGQLLPIPYAGNPLVTPTLLNLGAGLLVSIVIYVFFERGIKSINSMTAVPRLGLTEIIEQVARSVRSVKILETWEDLLGDRFFERFASAASRAIDQGAIVQILLIHPDSAAAVQRAKQLSSVIDVAAQIRLSLARAFILMEDDSYPKLSRPHIAVRVYRSWPPIALHMCDSQASVGFFRTSKPANEASNIEVSTASRLSGDLDDIFDEIWKDDTTLNLEDHMLMQLVDGAHSLNTMRAYYAPGVDDANAPIFYVSDRHGAELIDRLKDGRVTFELEKKRYTAACRRLTSTEREEKVRALDLLRVRYAWRSDRVLSSRLQTDPEIVRLEDVRELEG